MQARAAELCAEGRIPQAPENVILALVTDREMASINRDAMQVQGPTNILSFPDDGSGEGTAELALDVAMLHREAFVYGQQPLRHLLRHRLPQLRAKILVRLFPFGEGQHAVHLFERLVHPYVPYAQVAQLREFLLQHFL